MILGTHFLLNSTNADADRTFFRDVLGFRYVDAGQGWLIFAASPAEVAIHPMDGPVMGSPVTDGAAEGGGAQPASGHSLLGGVLYLMCDDLTAHIAELKAKNVQCSEIETARWGMVTTIPLPSGGRIGLYEPRHKTALDLK
jgi:catechol 2,3-dioxygenase-like lactoylglutathione lyase family enzyme